MHSGDSAQHEPGGACRSMQSKKHEDLIDLDMAVPKTWYLLPL
ncbi:uncharacterized protein ANIA_11520 [Aspergillus nidulans FGSC A4]|uniref:Uncharacterized protein n=1 Tax=Emericella nidulans (strain FGSC A4 / ATCC 38163 / CBS 112.46 / NRRL 194 / M139) TaxID=227321 RepID=C8V0I8_EMENI|nr:hypothetical protein [Aspergillus nidulans FGSC A4]CBF70880.1 TPA: hypothetical protein ANIA_11520 [Aspergillus nidulans FGSC A4]